MWHVTRSEIGVGVFAHRCDGRKCPGSAAKEYYMKDADPGTYRPGDLLFERSPASCAKCENRAVTKLGSEYLCEGCTAARRRWHLVRFEVTSGGTQGVAWGHPESDCVYDGTGPCKGPELYLGFGPIEIKTL